MVYDIPLVDVQGGGVLARVSSSGQVAVLDTLASTPGALGYPRWFGYTASDGSPLIINSTGMMGAYSHNYYRVGPDGQASRVGGNLGAVMSLDVSGSSGPVLFTSQPQSVFAVGQAGLCTFDATSSSSTCRTFAQGPNVNLTCGAVQGGRNALVLMPGEPLPRGGRQMYLLGFPINARPLLPVSVMQ